MTGRRRTRVYRAWLLTSVAAAFLRRGQSGDLAHSTTGSGRATVQDHAAGRRFDERADQAGGSPRSAAGRSSGSASLLEKYTFRETVRTVIEEDQLPELPDFLGEIGLGDKLEDFYRKSVFETKYIFTLNDMDLRLMGLSAEDIATVKEHAEELRVERDVTEERLHPLLQKRNELTYGRLFIDRSASSFEFYLAGFGPPVPVDEASLIWAEPRDACGTLTNSGMLPGTIVLAERGRCSFVDKANTVASSNALALVVINNGPEGEDLFRVAATLGGRSGGGEEPKGPENMPTVLVRGSALPPLAKALEWTATGDGSPVMARLVALDCKPGRAACEAVLPEEQQAEKQVDSGRITIVSGLPASSPSSTAKGVDDAKGAAGAANASEASFEFLSATFGATLPRGHVSVVPSVPEDACHPIAPLAAESSSSSGSGSTGDSSRGGRGVGGRGGGVAPVAVLVKRGACSFGVKAKNVQEAGGRVIIFHDNGLGVLQNVGAPDPLAKELYIPGVFVTARAGDSLVAANNNKNGQDGKGMGPLTVTFEPDNAIGRAWGALGATQWPNDLLEARVLARQLRATHASSPCRTKWVDDRVRRAEGLPTEAGTPSEQKATTAAATMAVAPGAGEASAAGTLPRKTAAALKDTDGVQIKATPPEEQRPSTEEEEEEEEQRGNSEQEPCSSEEVSPEVAKGVDGVRGTAMVGGEGEGEVGRGSCKEKRNGEGEGERRGGLKEL
ncbi:unnamed protein product [Ectocarpus sp. 13 AM-2016]